MTTTLSRPRAVRSSLAAPRSVKVVGFRDCPKGIRPGKIEADPAGVRVEVLLKVSGMVEP